MRCATALGIYPIAALSPWGGAVVHLLTPQVPGAVMGDEPRILLETREEPSFIVQTTPSYTVLTLRQRPRRPVPASPRPHVGSSVLGHTR